MAGLFTASLYAIQRFTCPAIATAIYNLGIVVAAPLLVERIGVYSLAIGVLLGSSAQLLLMLWDLHSALINMRPRIDWRHPALRRILRLYAPIAASLIVSIFQIGLDRRLASTTGVHSIAWDPIDQAGNAVVPGVYFLELQTGASRTVSKAVVLR